MSKKLKKNLSLEPRVLDFIREHQLIAGQKTLLVAVSGGQDSICLLYILNNLQSTLGIKLHIAHLDHQLRGAQSIGDARYVGRLAKKLGIPVTIGHRNVSAYRSEHGSSMEEAAREVRYSFLADTAVKIGTDCVAVGHTLDDHTETILLHLIRGTGIRGLRGLQPVSRWQSAEKKLRVIRPLLEVRRGETAEYCVEHRLKPRLDTTNLSLKPMRNKIRLELLPLLKQYNPQIIEALLRTAHIASDDIAHLEKEANRLWCRIASYQAESIVLDKKLLVNLSPSMKRYVIRLAIEEITGNLKDIEARHIEEVVQALYKPTGKTINLPDELVFAVDYNRYVLGRNPLTINPFPVLKGEHAIKVPGITIVSGWCIKTNIIAAGEVPEIDDKFVAYFNFDAVGDGLVVRSRKRGDRFQPLGMKHMKKLGDFMIDARIPHSWRDNIPIIDCVDGILWVTGYRIDERVKVTDNARLVLCIKFERI